jgi:hypothetical protein
MSTNDVPGANPVNKDELHTGCWAENADGVSLILVLSTEDNKVYYDLFDLSRDPPVTYRDAMPVGDFMLEFSYDVANLPKNVKNRKKVTSEKWTWHDKTPFPMSRVVDAGVPGGVQLPAVPNLMTAAERVRQALKLRAQKIDPGRFSHLSDTTFSGVRSAAGIIAGKMRRAFGELRK